MSGRYLLIFQTAGPDSHIGHVSLVLKPDLPQSNEWVGLVSRLMYHAPIPTDSGAHIGLV